LAFGWICESSEAILHDRVAMSAAHLAHARSR
jgi:hypothetical protein